MCIEPLKILSRKSNYTEGRDKVYNLVPCGRCYECVQQKADDWYVRSVYEFERCKRIGGATYFPTFTYNEQSLPYLSTDEEKWLPLYEELERESNIDRDSMSSIPYISDMCFDKLAVQKMFRRFRQYSNNVNEHIHLYDNEGHKITEGLEFKYFVTSELGSNTKRPHYHVLLYSEKKLNVSRLKDILQLSWSVRVTHKDCPKELISFYKKHPPVWSDKGYLFTKDNLALSHYPWYCDYALVRSRGSQKSFEVHKLRGFVSWSNKGPEINSPAGCRYVSKYITKQFIFEDSQPWIGILRDFLRGFPRPYEGDCVDELRNLRYCLPFTLASQFFGEDIEHELRDAYDNENIDEYLKHPIKINGDITSHRVPQYIINRVFYQNRHYVNYHNDKVIRYLTPIGYTCLLSKFNKKIDDLSYNISLIFDCDFVNMFPSSVFDDAFRGLLKTQHEVYNKYPPKYIACYSILFQDVVGKMPDSWYTSKNVKYLDDALDFYQNYLDTYNDHSPDEMSPYECKKMAGNFDFDKEALLNNMSQFEGLDFLLSVFKMFRERQSAYISSLDKDDEKRKYIIRAMHNMSY